MPEVQLGRLAWIPIYYNLSPAGIVKARADLPHNAQPGEVWFVQEDGSEHRYVWTGNSWWTTEWVAPTDVDNPKYSLPENFLLTNLTLCCERAEKSISKRWLKVGFRPLVGEPLKLDPEEKSLGFAAAPASNGGSLVLRVPDGCVISKLQIVGKTAGIAVWYRQILGPTNFKLGPESPISQGQVRPGFDTKEPRSDGEGYEASQAGSIMTALQILKDPDATWSILIAYRPVL